MQRIGAVHSGTRDAVNRFIGNFYVKQTRSNLRNSKHGRVRRRGDALPRLAPVRRRERALRAHACGLAAAGSGLRQGDAGGASVDCVPACGRRK